MLKPNKRHARGFTLIEAALSTVIIGTGMLAIVAAQEAYHRKNDIAQQYSTAMLLGNELREMTLTLPMNDPFTGNATLGPEANEFTGGAPDVTLFDDVDDFAGPGPAFAGLAFNPPINALRQQVPNMNGWSQFIQIENVLPDNVSAQNTQPLGTTPVMRVTATISFQGANDPQANLVTQVSWLIE